VITLADTCLGSEGSSIGGQTADGEYSWARCSQANGNKPGRPRSHGLQLGLPGNAVESVVQVQLQGHILRAVGQARPERVVDALTLIRHASSERKGGEGRAGIAKRSKLAACYSRADKTRRARSTDKGHKNKKEHVPSATENV
jgi:hypothetical protein